MKRVLVFGLGETFGGVEQYFFSRLNYLTEQAIVDFAYPVGTKISYKDKFKNWNCQIITIPKLSRPLSYFSCIKKIIKAKHYDIVYSNQAFANGLLYLAVKQAGAKLIVHAHNTSIAINDFAKEVVLKYYHYLSRFLFTGIIDSKYGCSKEAYIWMFGESNNISIRKNAIDAILYQYNFETREKIRKELKLQGSLVFGHIGRFSIQKNHTFLIDVFRVVHQKYPESKLLLIGDGELKDRIVDKVQRLNLIDSVLFLGQRNDVPDILQAMDCFVLPSLFEGLGIVSIEAQAAGLPCALSNNVPKEVKIIESVRFISLNESLDYWTNELLLLGNLSRINSFKQIKDAGYDLKTSMMSLSDFFS